MSKNHKYLIFYLILETIIKQMSFSTPSTSPQSLTSSSCDDLPQAECKYVNYRHYQTQTYEDDPSESQKHEGVLCENEFNEKTLRAIYKTATNCSYFHESIVTFTIKPARASSKHSRIVDRSFNAFKLGELLWTQRQTYMINLQFLFVRGFDIDSRFDVIGIATLLFYTNFSLYKHKRLIVNGCREFNYSSHKFIFYQRDNDGLDFKIYRPKTSSRPICPAFFRHADLVEFSLTYMANSFYLKNMISFTNDSFASSPLNARIAHLYVYESYGLDLDARLLNRHVFEFTQHFGFQYHVNSIDRDVFGHFERLKSITFASEYLLPVIRKQGCEWLKSINRDVNVDLNPNATNTPSRDHHLSQRVVVIKLDLTRDTLLDLQARDRGRQHQQSRSVYVSDSDFCLFAEFPFRQLVFMITSADRATFFYRNKTEAFSCAELWLFQFYKMLNQLDSEFFYLEYDKLKSSDFETCNFEKRLRICNKTHFLRTNESIILDKESNRVASGGSSENDFSYYYSWFDFTLAMRFALIVLAPVLAAYGLLTNLAIVFVIWHEKSKKTMREKHYIYMSCHSVTNAITCLIQIVGLIHECQFPFGFYCSSIRRSLGVQYFKIVFGEYFNTVCRLFANFTYLGFSLYRLSKVGNDHSKFVRFMHHLGVKKFVGSALLASACLSVCKCLQFDINVDVPELAYPLPFTQNPYRFGWQFKSGYVAVTVINAVCDMINYFGFVLVHLVVDVVLVRKLRRVFEQKEDKMRELGQGEKEIERASLENEQSRRRTLFMVIFGSVLNLVTKVPLMITSLNDVRLLILSPYEIPKQYDWILYNFNYLKTSLSLRFFCHAYSSCLLFQNAGNCLFLVSLSVLLFFLKSFDRNFQIAYEQVFNSAKEVKKLANKNVKAKILTTTTS